MVLRSLPKPAWLREPAPEVDVVLSSRYRVMRNVRGHRFPHATDPKEAIEVMRRLLAAAAKTSQKLVPNKSVTNAERNYLVACRLISPEFLWTLPGRALLLDEARSLSLLINEEDHLRLQALTAGWSHGVASESAKATLAEVGRDIEFARSERWGYLAASPYNAGQGVRRSCMMHLTGLAHAGRLPEVMRALAAQRIIVRGLFGESSRAVGAYVQVSTTQVSDVDFVGACEYLIDQERATRREVTRETVRERVGQVVDFLQASRNLELADAFRILAWLRWGAASGVYPRSVRDLDAVLVSLEPGLGEGADAARARAVRLREALA
jgi:protein arginine kinase